jgi:hypothetical protein
MLAPAGAGQAAPAPYVRGPRGPADRGSELAVSVSLLGRLDWAWIAAAIGPALRSGGVAADPVHRPGPAGLTGPARRVTAQAGRACEPGSLARASSQHGALWRTFLTEQRAPIRELDGLVASLPLVRAPALLLTDPRDTPVPACSWSKAPVITCRGGRPEWSPARSWRSCQRWSPPVAHAGLACML